MANQNQTDLALPVRVILTDTTGLPSSNTAVTIADNGDAAEGATTDVAWLSGNSTVMALLKRLSSPFATQLDYDGSGNLIYYGMALPGTAVGTAAWQIRAFTYSGTNPATMLWAGGAGTFVNVWTNRAALTYS